MFSTHIATIQLVITTEINELFIITTQYVNYRRFTYICTQNCGSEMAVPYKTHLFTHQKKFNQLASTAEQYFSTWHHNQTTIESWSKPSKVICLYIRVVASYAT